MRWLTAGLLVVVLAGALDAGATTPPTDAYIAGYAAAVLEREFQARTTSLRVQRGVVSIHATDLGSADRARVREALSRITGVVRIEIREAAGSPPPIPGARGADPAEAPGPQAQAVDDLSVGLLPSGQLFTPLLADPRWPRFSAAYQYYLDDRQLGSVAAVSVGGTLPLFRQKLGRGWWETGLQAGVFALFDAEAPSSDLVNADYLIAGFIGYRYDRYSAIARLYHQSSHLGDEFVLANRVSRRVNLSYEAIDVRASSMLFDDLLRLYGGGGFLFSQEPASLEPGFLQWGLELRSRWRTAAFRPIAAADVQNREANHWHADLSLRAGIELDNWLTSRSLQIMLEYFRGHSPNGQFFRERIDYLGLGTHFHF
jgi:hypothetical protein